MKCKSVKITERNFYMLTWRDIVENVIIAKLVTNTCFDIDKGYPQLIYCNKTTNFAFSF